MDINKDSIKEFRNIRDAMEEAEKEAKSWDDLDEIPERKNLTTKDKLRLTLMQFIVIVVSLFQVLLWAYLVHSFIFIEIPYLSMESTLGYFTLNGVFLYMVIGTI